MTDLIKEAVSAFVAIVIFSAFIPVFTELGIDVGWIYVAGLGLIVIAILAVISAITN